MHHGLKIRILLILQLVHLPIALSDGKSMSASKELSNYTKVFIFSMLKEVSKLFKRKDIKFYYLCVTLDQIIKFNYTIIFKTCKLFFFVHVKHLLDQYSRLVFSIC